MIKHELLTEQNIDRAKKLLLISLYGLLVTIGIHKGVKVTLYTSGILGALLLGYTLYKDHVANIPKFFALPIVFILYVLISPGTFFIDARLAGRFACAFFAGFALLYFFQKDMKNVLLSQSAAFLLTLLLGASYAALFAPEMFTNRLQLSYGNPHRLATNGAFTLILFTIFHDTLSSKRRPLLYGIVVIIATAILLSVSRSTFMGLMFAGTGYILFYRAKHMLKILTVTVLVGSLLGVLCFTVLSPTQKQRVIDPITAPLHDHTIKQRIAIWYTAIKGIKEAPILGHALRGYSDFDSTYKAKHYDEMVKKNLLVEKRRWSHPHSIYLGSVFGWGVVGTFLLISAFIPALRHSTGRAKLFLVLMTCFNLGYGLTELRITSDDGAFFVFFPLGVAYGSILVNVCSKKAPGKLSNHLT